MFCNSQMVRVVVAVVGLVGACLANTEKTIFLGPKTINMPSTHPNLEDLRLDSLTPEVPWLRTEIVAQFPNNLSVYGRSTWLILDGLRAGQRYEVRVCWIASQPTEFRLRTYELPTVFDAPELISDLSSYSWSRQTDAPVTPRDDGSAQSSSRKTAGSEKEVSVLLLHILAAADYFTTDQDLMQNVPPVRVDIILDPYIFNMLPQSLLPTVAYIIIVGITTWFLAGRIAPWLRGVAQEQDQYKKVQ